MHFWEIVVSCINAMCHPDGADEGDVIYMDASFTYNAKLRCLKRQTLNLFPCSKYYMLYKGLGVS